MMLRDFVALVTGGGRGLGREFALSLAEAGAAVAVVARSGDQIRETVQLIEDAGGSGVAVACDVTDRAMVESMVAQVALELGPIDILVNNAGIYQAAGVVWEADPDAWRREIEVNLLGPYLCTRAVLPAMVQRGRGRIINVASSGGIFPWTHSSAYSASKAALIRLSEITALEAGEFGISVFSIDPGTVHTPMLASIVDSDDVLARAPHIAAGFQQMIEREATRPPDDAARLVVSLASGAADVLSGCYLGVDEDLVELSSSAELIREHERYTLRIRT